MDVFLVPVGDGRFALYCESSEAGPEVPAEGSSLWTRLLSRFSAFLSTLERNNARLERSRRAAARLRRKGWTTRLRMRAVRWMAEKVAEQRLLWHLRSEREACALYPAGLDEERAMKTIRRILANDFNRHRWWLALNTLAGAGALALTPIPGPNVIGFYFAFRIVGHFLSVRGARQGLDVVTWRLQESCALAELGSALELPQVERDRVVDEVSRKLGLRRLPMFFQRTAVNPA